MNRDGIVIAEFSCMGWICQHCGAPFVDSAYRVKSEESGVVLLDLIVCHGCYVQARELGLRTEEIGVRYRSPAETNSSSRQRLKRAVPPMAERNGREDMEQQK